MEKKAPKKAAPKVNDGGMGEELLILEASQDGEKYEPDGCPVKDERLAKVMAGMALMALGKQFPNMKFRLARYKRTGAQPLDV